MKLFKKQRVFLAPCDGEVIELSRVPDPVFSEGMLGIGIAVEPLQDTVCSPVDGQVVSIADAAHAYTLLSEDGLELLLHVGIDTVELKGEGYHPAVAIGDRVRAGDPLVRIDREKIQARGYALTTPLIVTNPECLGQHTPVYGNAEGGKTPILRYTLSE